MTWHSDNVRKNIICNESFIDSAGESQITYVMLGLLFELQCLS